MKLIILWLYLVCLVTANTEIVNFAARYYTDDVIAGVAEQWLQLNSSVPQRSFSINPAPLSSTLDDVCSDSGFGSPCPHELWVTLDLDSKVWDRFSKFTLRLSWPASSPADFLITTHPPNETRAILSKHKKTQIPRGRTSSITATRRQHARIRAVDTGLRAPSRQKEDVKPIPFILLLEPLYFGVLPKSVIPIVLFLVPVVLCATLVAAPFVNKFIARIAAEARLEYTEGAGSGKKYE
ncbi:unnamed protein product [Somion occarium]|uniref:Uncharacterized protein n=1 Tax=Somion occarium TaxID=3059160 RepID=A0ABP1CGN6_9APHY